MLRTTNVLADSVTLLAMTKSLFATLPITEATVDLLVVFAAETSTTTKRSFVAGVANEANSGMLLARLAI